MLSELLALEVVVRPQRGPDRSLLNDGKGFMVALMVPEELQGDIAKAAGLPGDEVVWPGDMHCTLNYVTDPNKFAEAVRVVEQVAQRYVALELATTRVGFFTPDVKPGRSEDEQKLVHYMGCAGPELMAFQGDLHASLEAAGIESDRSYPLYVPHITIQVLNRKKDIGLVQGILQSSAGRPAVKFVPRLAVVNGDRGQHSEIAFGESPYQGRQIYRQQARSAESRVDSALQALAEIETSASKSTLGRHMVRAVYQSQRGRGQSPKQAAQSSFAISSASLRGNGLAGSGPSARLSASGGRRSKDHAREPKTVLKNKDREFGVIHNLARTSGTGYSSKRAKIR